MRRALNVILGALVLVLASRHANTHDTADAIETWSEEKLARAERARREPRAVIWSARCERKGMDTVAHKADTGPWTTRCTPRIVYTMPKAGA